MVTDIRGQFTVQTASISTTSAGWTLPARIYWGCRRVDYIVSLSAGTILGTKCVFFYLKKHWFKKSVPEGFSESARNTIPSRF